MTVDFMIVGAQKCGTTTLFKLLDRHEALIGSSVKEPHFFSTEPDWGRALERYETLFPPGREGLRFEASTSYTFSPHRKPMIWKNLWDYNAELKLIYLVRRPLQRIISGYMHNVQRGYTDRPLEEEILRNPLYLDITRYASQIRPFIRTFGRERVLLIDFDDLISRREEVLSSVAQFLDVDAAGLQGADPVHANRSLGSGGKDHHRFDDPSIPLRLLRTVAPPVYGALKARSRRIFHTRPSLPPDLGRSLLELLGLEIDALEVLMEKDLSAWRDLPTG